MIAVLLRSDVDIDSARVTWEMRQLTAPKSSIISWARHTTLLYSWAIYRHLMWLLACWQSYKRGVVASNLQRPIPWPNSQANYKLARVTCNVMWVARWTSIEYDRSQSDTVLPPPSYDLRNIYRASLQQTTNTYTGKLL